MLRSPHTFIWQFHSVQAVRFTLRYGTYSVYTLLGLYVCTTFDIVEGLSLEGGRIEKEKGTQKIEGI